MHEKQRFTELRETREALRASELGWRNLTEALPQLVWSAMADGSCDYFSAQWTEHTGVPTHEAGRNKRDILHYGNEALS